ncbi:hypothetical protein O0L34_g14199 [Tuta absoluta]|nr:hypothetical protein O0L34_g14199 [Tuta absoluta]
MKCILLLLPFVAACACAAAVVDTAAESVPDAAAAPSDSIPDAQAEPSDAVPDASVDADSIPAAAEYGDSYGGYYGSGYDRGYNRDGRRYNEYSEEYRDGGYRDERYRDERYRDDRYRDDRNVVYEGVYKESIFDGKDYRMFFVPKLVGRQGLGFQKRNYYSGGMRFPITPEILEPIGYRPLIKDLYFVPLQKNYNN